MNIQIIEGTSEPIQVIIKCQKITEQITNLQRHLELFDSKLQAKRENTYCFVNAAEVLYFEAVENRTFLYTEAEVLEIKQKLYELELILSDKDFIRISKSQIVNIGKIKALRPELNRTILATMCNDEQLSISRKYVPHIKKLLSI